MNAPLVLALDTATDVAALALLSRQGASFHTLSTRRTPSARSHTHALLTSVEECLAESGADAGRLGAVVVGTGPGTFTGVRIAVATARALALSLSIPVVGVPTLAGLAAGALDDGLPAEVSNLVALVDARRGQVFGALYRRQEAEEPAAWVRSGELFVTEPQNVPREAARALGEGFEPAQVVEGEMSGEATLFVGAVAGVPGRVQSRTLQARHLLLGQDLLLEPLSKVPRPEDWLAQQLEQPVDWGQARPGSLGTPETVYPVYVRAPDADVHITRMRDPWAS